MFRLVALAYHAITDELLDSLFRFGSVQSQSESMECFLWSFVSSIMNNVKYILKSWRGCRNMYLPFVKNEAVLQFSRWRESFADGSNNFCGLLVSGYFFFELVEYWKLDL